MTLEPKQKPVHEVRFGNVRVSIWANRNQEGQLFHSFALERSYRDQSGEWQSQQLSLSLTEIAKVTGALNKAYADYYTLPNVRQDAERSEASSSHEGAGQ